MTDGLGSVTYEYNQLSQLTAETRQFNDSLPNAPQGNNSFRLEYGYSISGQMKFYKDAYGQQINYTQDKIGRLNSVTGSTGFGGVTNYAGNAQYRAWGALKHLEYGDDNAQMNLAFNNRLQAAADVVLKGSDTVINKEYSYLPTGELSFIDDKRNVGAGSILDSNRFDRSFRYNHLGRLIEAKTGAEARGSTDDASNIPYLETMTYNSFGNGTSLLGSNYTNSDIGFYSPNYVNNRAEYQIYDAEGNQTSGGALVYTYESSGRTSVSTGETVENASAFDGDGQELKRIRKTRADDQSVWSSPQVGYFIVSTALGGQIVDEVKADGAKDKGYVYGEGAIVARQLANTGNGDYVNWEHPDASGMSKWFTGAGSAPTMAAQELDLAGNNVGFTRPLTFQPVNKTSPLDPLPISSLTSSKCQLDGIDEDCLRIAPLLKGGAASIDVGRSDPDELRKWNIVPVYGYRSTDRKHEDDPNKIVVHTDEERYLEGYMFGSSWDMKNTTVPTQSTNSQTQDNPNCFLNALIYKDGGKSTGIGRFFNNVHDGRHAIGRAGIQGTVITLPAATGKVVLVTGDNSGTAQGGIVDVWLDNLPYVASYKDVVAKVKNGQRLSNGSVIGTTSTSGESSGGYHFTLVNKAIYGRRLARPGKDGNPYPKGTYRNYTWTMSVYGDYRMTVAQDARQKLFDRGLIIDPAGINSVFNCPGRGIIRTGKIDHPTEDNPSGN